MVWRTRKSMLDKEAKTVQNYFLQIRFYKCIHTGLHFFLRNWVVCDAGKRKQSPVVLKGNWYFLAFSSQKNNGLDYLCFLSCAYCQSEAWEERGLGCFYGHLQWRFTIDVTAEKNMWLNLYELKSVYTDALLHNVQIRLHFKSVFFATEMFLFP